MGNARVVHGGVRSDPKGARGKGGYGGREEDEEAVLASISLVSEINKRFSRQISVSNPFSKNYRYGRIEAQRATLTCNDLMDIQRVV